MLKRENANLRDVRELLAIELLDKIRDTLEVRRAGRDENGIRPLVNGYVRRARAAGTGASLPGQQSFERFGNLLGVGLFQREGRRG